MNTPATSRSSPTKTQPKPVPMTTAPTEMISSTMNATNRLNAAVGLECNHCELPVRLHRSSRIPVTLFGQMPCMRLREAVVTKAARKSQSPKRVRTAK